MNFDEDLVALHIQLLQPSQQQSRLQLQYRIQAELIKDSPTNDHISDALRLEILRYSKEKEKTVKAFSENTDLFEQSPKFVSSKDGTAIPQVIADKFENNPERLEQGHQAVIAPTTSV